jgi:hypothetical protein
MDMRDCFYAPGVFFFAVVSDESDRVIEFFPSQVEAEMMLADV